MEVIWRLLELSWDVYRSDGPSSELVGLSFSVSEGRGLFTGPTDHGRWVFDRGDLALVPSARFPSCVIGVTAMGSR